MPRAAVLARRWRLLAAVGVAGVLLATNSFAATHSDPMVLQAPSPQRNGLFGTAVAVHGDVVLVGQPGSFNGEHMGLVHVWEMASEGWVHEEVWTGGDVGDRFGADVSIHEDVAAVGSWNRVGEASGCGVFVFARTSAGWREESCLSGAADGSDYFGSSVATDGTWLAVGSPGGDGAVHVYKRTDSQWRLDNVLTVGVPIEGLGSDVALHDDLLVAGAPGHGPGSVHVWRYHEPVWVYEANLQAPLGGGARLGSAVAVHGNLIVAGADRANGTHERQGAAVIFEHSTGWKRSAMLRSDEPGFFNFFGSSVAIQGGDVFVGAMWEYRPEKWGSEGSVHHFARQADTWERQRVFQPWEEQHGAHFGSALAIDGNRLLVGAPGGGAGPGYTLTVQAAGPHVAADTGYGGTRGPDDSGLAFLLDLALDPDGDAVSTHDNCPQAWNPDQADRDLDGRGDACDETITAAGIDLGEWPLG